MSVASHPLWIFFFFFIFLQMRKQRSEHSWKRIPREICESHRQEIWKDRGKDIKEERDKSEEVQITNHTSPLLSTVMNWLVCTHNSKAWISSPETIQKLNYKLSCRNLKNKTSNFILLLAHLLQKLAIPYQAFP